MTLQERFDRHLLGLGLPGGPALVAVSGGPDSLVLLDLLAHAPLAAGSTLHVAHLDHGIHPDSGTVAEAVRAVAARYRLPFHTARLGLGATASETAARTARYARLNQLADDLAAELIFTAHHQDDQVETILMRMLRGSGPAGLAGIPTRRGRLVRPLLPFRREELAGHLHQIGGVGWSDPANRDPRHERSWLRQEVLPALRNRWPDVDRRILSVGRQAATDRAAWDAVLGLWQELDLKRDGTAVSVAATPLRGYDSGVLRALLAALGRRAGCLVGPARAARIGRLVAQGRSGALAELGGGFSAELSFDRLRLFRTAAHPVPWERHLIEGGSGSVEVGGVKLTWNFEAAPARIERNQPASWFSEGRFAVRPWRAGDRVRPLGGKGRRLVVRCMQDLRIARTRRAAWPVIETGGVVVWVPGVCRSADRIPAPGTRALRINADFR